MQRSSLLQKANGGDVYISEEARRKASSLVASVNIGEAGAAAIGGVDVMDTCIRLYGSGGESREPAPAAVVTSTNNRGETTPTTTRKSSLLQKANGGDVYISEEARRKASSMLASVNMNVGVESMVTSSSAGSYGMEEENRGPAPAAAAITVTSATSKDSLAVNNRAETTTTRKSSLLQKANGGDVYISEEARRKASSMLASVTMNIGEAGVAPVEAIDTSVGLYGMGEDSSGPVSAPVPAPAAVVTTTSGDNVWTNNSGETTINTTRKSSLLQKANGGDVYVSEEARRRASSMLAPVNMDMKMGEAGGVKAMDTNVGLCGLGGESREPAAAVVASRNNRGEATTTRKSSLLQKANGGNVYISEEARRKASSMLASVTIIETAAIGVVEAMDTSLGLYGMGGESRETATAVTSTTTEHNLAVNNRGDTATTRKSSLLQKANGGDVYVSEEARRKASSMLASVAMNIGEAGVAPVEAVNTSASIGLYGMGEEGRESGPTAVTIEENVCKSNRGGTTTTRKSSLLQKANGGDVYFSEETRRKASSMLASVSVNVGEAGATPAISHGRPLEHGLDSTQSSTGVAWNRTDSVLSLALKDKPTCPFISLPASNFLFPLSYGSYSRKYPSVSSQSVSEALSLFQSSSSGSNLSFTSSFPYIDAQPFPLGDNSVPSLLSHYLYSQLQPSETMSKEWLSFQIHWILWTLISYYRRQLLNPSIPLFSPEVLFHCLLRRYYFYYGNNNSSTSSTGATPNITSSNRKASTKRGVISPLHRCESIETFLWPLCLCIMIKPRKAVLLQSNSNNKNIYPGTSSSGSQYTIEVTDGWWKTKAALDEGLLQLVQKGKLRDGYKIVVFSGSFSRNHSQHPEEENSSSTTSPFQATLVLNYNAVRCAHPRAALGYVHPRYLSRGLSVASLRVDGGPIYAMKVQVVAITQPIVRVNVSEVDNAMETMGFGSGSRLKGRERNNSNSSSSNNNSTNSRYLSGYLVHSVEEYQWLCHQIEQWNESQQIRHQQLQEEDSPDFEVRNTGRSRFADDRDYQEQQNPSFYKAEPHSYRDVLGRCLLSNQLCWIRFPVPVVAGFNSVIEDESDRMTVNQYQVDDLLFITNLKYQRMTVSTLFLSLSNTSYSKRLPKANQAIPHQSAGLLSTSKNIIKEKKKSNQLLHQGKIITFSHLHLLFASFSYEEILSLIGSELSLAVMIIDWSIDSPDNFSSNNNTTTTSNSTRAVVTPATVVKENKKLSLQVVNLRLFVCDPSHYCLEIIIPILREYIPKLDWLQKDQLIYLETAVIQEIDLLHEIIRLQKLDHFQVKSISSPVASNHNISSNNHSNSSNVSLTSPSGNLNPPSEVSCLLSQTDENRQETVTPKNPRKRKTTTFITPKASSTTTVAVVTEQKNKKAKVEQISLESLSSITQSFIDADSSRSSRQEEWIRYQALRQSHTHYVSSLYSQQLLLSCSRRTAYGKLSFLSLVQLPQYHHEDLDEDGYYSQPLHPVDSNSNSNSNPTTTDNTSMARLCLFIPYGRHSVLRNRRPTTIYQKLVNVPSLFLLLPVLSEKHRNNNNSTEGEGIVQVLYHQLLHPLSCRLEGSHHSPSNDMMIVNAAVTMINSISSRI